MSTENSYKSEECGRKKKKRSFLQTQKRFAKRGSFGRGTQLSQDVYDYFINIIKVMNAKKDDEEEMRVLASNILQEVDGKESEYCCNQIISRAMENLLPYSSDEEFFLFINKFAENLRPIFSDTFGSHVLQQTLIVAYKKYQNLISNSESSEKKFHLKFVEYIIRISNFLFNNLDEFIWDVYSNAIARTVFNVLSGNPVKGEVKKSAPISRDLSSPDDNFNGNNESKTPKEFISILKKFANKIISFPQFYDMCNDQVNSGFLQNLVFALENLDEKSELICKIIEFFEKNPLDLTDVDNTPFVRLLEVTLQLSPKSTVKKIYKLAIKENLIGLAKSKYGNFLVQKLLGNCQSKKLYGKIFALIQSEMEGILEAGNSGVLLELLKASNQFGICQGQCMTMLSEAFRMKGYEDIVPTVATLTPSDKLNIEKANFTVHGCLAVQEILNFKKPGNIVASLLAMTESNFVKLLCDTKGCHITDAFVNSLYVGEKNRDKFFKKLQGRFFELATSKHGSRSLDAIWSVTSVNQKAIIAEELKSLQSSLCGNVYGKNFAWKIHLDNYRRNKEEWMKVYRTSETAEKYFADIIPRKRQKIS